VLAKLRPDTFTLLLVGTVLLASVLPIEGHAAALFAIATDCGIALLFFLHGARLARDTVIAGATHWRLHLTVLAATFLLFPVLGLLINLTLSPLLTPALASGILFLCVLPSTVQSSIAFTAMAGGNVPAAVCAATASNLIGIVATPLLVALLFSARGVGFSFDVLWTIVVQLLLPFIAGQILQPLIGNLLRRHRAPLVVVDRGAILMVVYLAFSEAVASGLWHQFGLGSLAAMVAVDAALLAVVLVVTTVAARRLGFSREDEIVIVFCGSKKSLASGVPMANVIFAGQPIGAIVLPVMLFHQIQLMVCAWLAKHYAERRRAAEAALSRPPAAAE
jgi:solute carrier family 10 (sodium/bile acid cotransporter), member 7